MELWKNAVAAIKSGKKEEARKLFERILHENPENEKVLHWLAFLADTNSEKVNYLRRVLDINPRNERAGKAFQNVLFRQGLAASKRGDKATAKKIFSEITDYNPDNEKVWLWLASVSSSRGEKHRFLKKALVLDPENVKAKRWMARLESAKQMDTVPIKKPQIAEARAAAPRVRGYTQKNVVIVDDSLTVNKLVKVTLERNGYHVVTASNGVQALARINETPPNLIFLDIKMPGMDGYQVCKIIKGNVNTKGIPVVLLTGQDGFLDRVRARMVGASDYITKPFEVSTILNTAEKYCPEA